MGTRKYRNVHETYLAEFLGITYPPGTWKTNVRVGKFSDKLYAQLTESERRALLGVFGASADAIVFLKDKTVIIECMIRHEPGALEDLIKYKLLFLETPEYRSRWNLPVELVLLTPLDAPFYFKMAKLFGIKVIQYHPAWIDEYLNSYPRRFRRGKLSAVEFPEL